MTTTNHADAGVSARYTGSNTTVLAGQTYALSGTLAAGSMITVYGGNNTTRTGGELAIKTSAVNDGTIDLLGGVITQTSTQAASGASMLVTGTLTSYGDIAVHAGYGATSNAQITDHGVITNDGIVEIYGGIGGPTFSPGGELLVYGVLNNNGTMDLLGATSVNGEAGYQGGLRMLGPSTFNNTGLLDLYGAVGATGGRVALAGTLTNSGTILAQGGTQLKGSPADGQSGAAAVVDIGSSTLNNSGVIALDGGQSNGGPGVGEGSTLFQARQDSMVNTGADLSGWRLCRRLGDVWQHHRRALRAVWDDRQWRDDCHRCRRDLGGQWCLGGGRGVHRQPRRAAEQCPGDRPGHPGDGEYRAEPDRRRHAGREWSADQCRDVGAAGRREHRCGGGRVWRAAECLWAAERLWRRSYGQYRPAAGRRRLSRQRRQGRRRRTAGGERRIVHQ